MELLAFPICRPTISTYVRALVKKCFSLFAWLLRSAASVSSCNFYISLPPLPPLPPPPPQSFMSSELKRQCLNICLGNITSARVSNVSCSIALCSLFADGGMSGGGRFGDGKYGRRFLDARSTKREKKRKIKGREECVLEI